ncbi:hypothetical protein [Arthrobacter sp. SAFR-014]|uniref:hypothetical protein n=1 Tax=unclassified Arthrobacter TaxID=235627 RepID=UPI003F7CA14A
MAGTPFPKTPINNAILIAAALDAATVGDARVVQDLIARSVGRRYKRPVGDKVNNHGLIGSSGSYDLKLIELVTNMQDAVIERLALNRWRSPETVPYASPHEAAGALLPAQETLGEHPVSVVFRESDRPTSSTKRLTAVFRDSGCGLRPEHLPTTVFQLGGSYKEDRLYLQGAFGIGGAMTYRNARAVVVVSRRAPELLAPGEQDMITVAVVEWEALTKGASAYYLVDGPWMQPGDKAVPWSCPASDMPGFGPGTHVALISYGVDGLQRVREGDAKTFDTVVNTRLFRPVMPVRFTNEISGRGRSTNMRGLASRLRDNPNADRPEGEELLPFNSGGTTYQLPVRYWVFAKENQPGARSSFAAAGHVVLFLSNGQVHHHWTAAEFKSKTALKRLSDRILVTIDTDQLPIQLRTSLFTADRSDLVRNDPALRLEETVRSFLDDWEPLQQENSRLIREALRTDSDMPTFDIARRIGRILSLKGFALGDGNGSAGSAPGPGNASSSGGGVTKMVDLNADPTRITGPATARAEIGKTRSIPFTIDVVDTFFTSGRGQLTVECDHAGIGEQELALGQVRNGRFRVMVAVPEGLEPGIEELRISLRDWFKDSVGLGETITFWTKLELVEFIGATGMGSGKATGGGSGEQGAQPGRNVALVWTDHDAQDEWTRATVGEVVPTAAADLAATRSEYGDLASLGQALIPVVMLNQEYPPLKQYLQSRSRNLVSLDTPRETYALGVGLDLLLLHQEQQRRETNEEIVDEELLAFAHTAAARAVLSVMPAFDELAKQAGLDDGAD